MRQTGTVDIGVILGAVLLIVISTSLIGTVASRAENGAAEIERLENADNADEGFAYKDRTASPIVRLIPLFYVILIIAAVVAPVVVAFKAL